MKKIFNILLIIILCGTLISCKKEDEEDNKNNENIETNENSETIEENTEQKNKYKETEYIYVSEDGKYQTIVSIKNTNGCYSYRIKSLVSDGILRYQSTVYKDHNLIAAVYFNFPRRDTSNDPYVENNNYDEYKEEKEYIHNLSVQYNYDNCMYFLEEYRFPEDIIARFVILDSIPIGYIIFENEAEYKALERYFIDLILDKGITEIRVDNYPTQFDLEEFLYE